MTTQRLYSCTWGVTDTWVVATSVEEAAKSYRLLLRREPEDITLMGSTSMDELRQQKALNNYDCELLLMDTTLSLAAESTLIHKAEANGVRRVLLHVLGLLRDAHAHERFTPGTTSPAAVGATYQCLIEQAWGTTLEQLQQAAADPALGPGFVRNYYEPLRRMATSHVGVDIGAPGGDVGVTTLTDGQLERQLAAATRAGYLSGVIDAERVVERERQAVHNNSTPAVVAAARGTTNPSPQAAIQGAHTEVSILERRIGAIGTLSRVLAQLIDLHLSPPDL